MSDFFAEISKKIETFEGKIKECEVEYDKSAKFFCENPKDASEKLAEKFVKLWNSCKTCKRELERLKLAAKKEEEKKAKDAQKKVVIVAKTTVGLGSLAEKAKAEDIVNELKARRITKRIYFPNFLIINPKNIIF